MLPKPQNLRALLRRPRQARVASRAALGAAVLLVAVVLGQMEARFRRSTLFPDQSKRFDVTELYMAPLAGVCPDAVRTPTAAVIESCLPRLGLGEGRSPAFQAVRIPSLDELDPAEIPSFGLVLQRQGLESLTNVIRARQPYVLGLRIPSHLFRVNALGTTPNVLVLNGLADARICLDGRCPYVVDGHDVGVLPFPLVVRAVPRASAVDVVIVGRDARFPIGLLLQDGVFVTSYESLYAVRKLYPVMVYGKGLLLAMMFIGLFLLASGFAVTWADFPDYGAFCYLTASLAFLTLVSEGAMRDGDLLFGLRLSTWAWLNLLLSGLMFALATNRVSGRGLLRVFAVGLALSFALVALMPSTMADAIWWARYARLFIGGAVALLPPVIALWGAARCWRRYRAVRAAGPLSQVVDYRRRTVEQLCYGVILLLIGAQMLASGLLNRASRGDVSAFAPSAGALLFVTFAVILYHSTAKLAKTHFRSDGRSEATRLKGRLSMRRYLAWLAETRQGVMVQVDLKNSSLAAGALQSRFHVLMQRLHDAMQASHQRLGYHWILSKKNGDEWIVILAPKHASLADDLAEVTRATAADAAAWKRLVQEMAPECSIHVNVFALSAYTLSAGTALQAARVDSEGAWDAVDFESREANYFMKWAGKSRHQEQLTVGASVPAAAGVVPALTGTTIRVSRVVAQAGDASPESVFDVESLNLIFAFVPWGATSPELTGTTGRTGDPSDHSPSQHWTSGSGAA